MTKCKRTLPEHPKTTVLHKPARLHATFKSRIWKRRTSPLANSILISMLIERTAGAHLLFSFRNTSKWSDWSNFSDYFNSSQSSSMPLCSSCAASSRVFMLEATFVVSNRGRRLTSPENGFISTLLL